jgi:hypothetical protein
MEDKKISYEESLQLINTMISKAKDAYHDTGRGAMLWGTVIAVCALVRLSEIQFGYKLPFDINLLTLAAIVPQIFISIKEKKERKVKSYDDTFLDYIWLAFGICIFLLIHVVNLTFAAWEPVATEYRQLAGHASAFKFSEFVMPLFLILYGLPTFITGAACRFKPMFWGGIFCWVCSIIAVYSNYKVDLLLTAFSAIMAWFIPGLIMEKEYRLAKKKEAIKHV